MFNVSEQCTRSMRRDTKLTLGIEEYLVLSNEYETQCSDTRRSLGTFSLIIRNSKTNLCRTYICQVYFTYSDIMKN